MIFWGKNMFKKFLTPLLAAIFMASPLSAATFNFDITLDRVEGTGTEIGFFQTQSPGATGTGIVVADETESDYATLVQSTFFAASLIGGSGGSPSDKTVVQDGAAGTLTVSGFLAGLTGLLPGVDLIAPDTYEFVLTGDAFSEIANGADLVGFLDTVVDMSGFFSGFLFESETDTVAFRQVVFFNGDVSEVPLPAGVIFLLTGLGALALRRKG